jgi:hypothetical protein
MHDPIAKTGAWVEQMSAAPAPLSAWERVVEKVRARF